ncbi:hypothetical protein N9230_03470 [Akkermansiaceae bacterium]|nr:hypothetical protein [Akkermansiaceae bacterium]
MTTSYFEDQNNRIPGSIKILFSILLLASSLTLLGQAEEAKLRYRIEAKTFDSGEADIRKVLDYTARPLWKNFPGYKVEPMVITKSNSGPIVIFQRNARQEIVVKLDTHKTYWSQYAYQWAHELCHVLCGFREDGQDNKWFEETLCELASLYCMRAMVSDWENKPPYPHWKNYSKSLQDYVDNVISQYEKVDMLGLAEYYKKHEGELRKSATLRNLNGTMAAALLPVFEKNPQHWEAIRYLNLTPAKPGLTLKQYLAKWKKDAPKKHHLFIEGIARVYGLE